MPSTGRAMTATKAQARTASVEKYIASGRMEGREWKESGVDRRRGVGNGSDRKVQLGSDSPLLWDLYYFPALRRPGFLGHP